MRSRLSDLLNPFWKPLALAGGIALVDALWEPSQLKVTRLDLPIDDVSRQLVGLKLAQLSDLHVGGRGWRRGTLVDAIDACNRADVDLVAITGDFIGSVHGAADCLKLLSGLRADVPRLAVLGNHDHVHGGKPLQELLQGLDILGIRVLSNQALSLELPSGRLWVAGVNDGYGMRDDLDRVRRILGPAEFPRLLLTHYPDVADQLRPGEFQLVLAGHSHGGQVRLPFITSLVHNSHARTKYGSGLYWVNGNPLYVNPGLGVSGVPFRFRNWPELTLLRFAASGSAESVQADGAIRHRNGLRTRRG
jgi:predicted MPP superfamily phosphohydrolase